MPGIYRISSRHRWQLRLRPQEVEHIARGRQTTSRLSAHNSSLLLQRGRTRTMIGESESRHLQLLLVLLQLGRSNKNPRKRQSLTKIQPPYRRPVIVQDVLHCLLPNTLIRLCVRTFLKDCSQRSDIHIQLKTNHLHSSLLPSRNLSPDPNHHHLPTKALKRSRYMYRTCLAKGLHDARPS